MSTSRGLGRVALRAPPRGLALSARLAPLAPRAAAPGLSPPALARLHGLSTAAAVAVGASRFLGGGFTEGLRGLPALAAPRPQRQLVRTYASSAGGGKRISQTDFTEKAW